MLDEDREQQKLAEEDMVQERVDEKGETWRKVYFGGGPHFRNWLDQVIELRGEKNVQVEEVLSSGLKCFEDGGEKTYRIWVREAEQSEQYT